MSEPRMRVGCGTLTRFGSLYLSSQEIEFNPTNGTGRVFYRLGLNGAKFNLQTASGNWACHKPG